MTDSDDVNKRLADMTWRTSSPRVVTEPEKPEVIVSGMEPLYPGVLERRVTFLIAGPYGRLWTLTGFTRHPDIGGEQAGDDFSTRELFWLVVAIFRQVSKGIRHKRHDR